MHGAGRQEMEALRLKMSGCEDVCVRVGQELEIEREQHRDYLRRIASADVIRQERDELSHGQSCSV